ncbi:hypothetical protein, partial [Neisseria gonorrhoeae]|uniref:hypothetical protein n=1 Tax=Neisseria gonorrhoeae TaxID=485 RepID=UPI00311DB322
DRSQSAHPAAGDLTTCSEDCRNPSISTARLQLSQARCWLHDFPGTSTMPNALAMQQHPEFTRK